MATVKVTMDWDAIKKDPVEFAHKLLKGPDGNPFECFAAQQDILRGIKRRTVMNTGRQFSKTTTCGIIVTHAAMTHANWNICIIAPSLEQARIMMSEVEYHFTSGILATMVVGKIKQYPFPVIKLKNGTTITARGANSPQFIRGNRFHLIVVDEASFIKDITITQAIEPTMGVTGKHPDAALILASTPWGEGPFKEWYKESLRNENPRLAGFHYTSYDNPHFDREQLEDVKRRYGEDSLIWRTEYMAEFPDDDMSVIPWKDIQAALDAWPTMLDQLVDGQELRKPIDFPIKPIEGHRYVQGADLANLRDYFVSTILDITNPDMMPLSRMDRYQKRGYPAVKQTIRDNYATYNRAKTLIDSTTLAESVVQDLDDIHAEGYAFTGTSAKWEITQELARLFSERRVAIPNRRDITDELRFLQYDITPSGKVKAEASEGHDDICMSLGLCAHQAIRPTRLGLMQSVSLSPRRRPRKESRWQTSSSSSPESLPV
jgi:hypothetical protein